MEEQRKEDQIEEEEEEIVKGDIGMDLGFAECEEKPLEDIPKMNLGSLDLGLEF